jgi:hypothetical protein
MVLAHALALAVKALCVPACRSRFLLLPIQLNNIHLTLAIQRLRNEIFEPGNRSLPALVLRVPIRLVATVAAQPLEVVMSIGEPNK